MHVRPGHDVNIGAATVGVKCSHEGTEGYYVLAMPMQGEFVVISGRERFGEPKKIAEVASMEIAGNRVTTVIARHGIEFLEMSGEIVNRWRHRHRSRSTSSATRRCRASTVPTASTDRCSSRASTGSATTAP